MEILTTQGHPDFIDLPWDTPLAEWTDPRLVKMAHGISRHIVRFVRFGDRVYALKATDLKSAHTEFRLLRELRSEHLPVVEPVGVVSDTPRPGEAMLITRYLDYSLPYWYVLGRQETTLAERLMDAGVVLLVRLHLEGVFWGDGSLSNILWRRDAGGMMAYLVDAETAERRGTLSDAMRAYDVDIAVENVVGGLLDLQASGRVAADVDPIAIAESLRVRYDALWSELTRVDAFDLDERWRIDQRVRRINELGFDVEEMSINRDGRTLTIKPVLVDEGHHARELRQRTGLDVQENQARRLLADIDQHRAWMEREEGRSIPRAVATARWLAELYEPLLDAVPPELRDHLEPPELFHQLLEHRYLMSERRGEGVSTDEALADYLDGILQHQPAEQQLTITTLDSPIDTLEYGSDVSDPSGPSAPEPDAARRERARRAISLIDLTDLSDDHTAEAIDELCRRARRHGTAAVCVWSEYVSRCVTALAGSGVRVATVVNFPSGSEPAADVVAMTGRAISNGADDIDVVLPYEAFLAGDADAAGELVAQVAALIEPPRILKVILETSVLRDHEIIRSAAQLAIDAGADFVKTSTGKLSAGASLDAVEAMLGAVREAADAGHVVGVKPSGGIRTYDDAMAYLDLADSVMGEGWASPTTFRFGASGLLDSLLAVIDDTDPPAASPTY